jgi:ATP-dependent exoDNAse (exonuclease V) beta subunit
VCIHPLFEEDPEQEAQLTVELAEKATEDLPDGRTAILVRARTHLPAIVRELKRRGIRFRAVEIDLLAEVPVVGDLLALTRALLHPADRTAWLALLRGPYCGLTLKELHNIATRDEFGAIWDLLPETPRLEQFRRVMSEALRRVRRVSVRNCVEQTWIELGGPCCINEATFWRRGAIAAGWADEAAK